MKTVGKSITKIDGMALVTGKPVYTEDLAIQNALVVKCLRSPHAFARIKAIDTAKAKTVAGVACILTYKDVPQTRFTLAGQSYPEPSPYDRLILEDVVRYVGDEVAIIAAVDERTALKAMELIEVEYEVLEPVLDFETAIGNKSIVHPEQDINCNYDIGFNHEKNIISTHELVVGDVEAELAQSEVVVEETYYTQAQAHAMMETYRAFTYLDHAGRLIVVSSTQVPFHIRRHLARALEIPASKIRVIKPRIGGGFGGKQTGVGDVFAALVTLRTGQPAKIVYDRQETFTCTNSRHAMRLKVRMGANKAGIIQALDISVLSDSGAYGEHAPTVLSCVGEYTLPLYNKAKARRISGYAVYTNKMPGGAFRGYGATQGTFAVESTVNKLAEKLGMDPSEVRLKNIARAGEPFLSFGGKPLGSSTLEQCIIKGKEIIGWDRKYPAQEVGTNKVRALGMAVTMQGSGIANVDTASAEVRLNDDGSYTLFVGSTDNGMGSDTIMAQMAAEILETSVEDITVIAADTDTSPYDPGAYASSGTYVTGMAVVKAATNLKEKILEAGANYLGVASNALELDGQTIKSQEDDQQVKTAKIAELSVLGTEGQQLVGQATHGEDTSPPPFVAGFAEVEVDKETGKVDVINYVAVIDCGTVINPNLAKIQAEGGIVQGLGMALYEDIKYDSNGKLLTDSFMNYKIPTRKDVGTIQVAFESSYEPTGPFGAKSIGEVVNNTPPPAIVHAVYNAVGVQVTKLPITPEKVFMEIRN